MESPRKLEARVSRLEELVGLLMVIQRGEASYARVVAAERKLQQLLEGSHEYVTPGSEKSSCADGGTVAQVET